MRWRRVPPGVLLVALVVSYAGVMLAAALDGSYFFVRKSAIIPAFALAALVSSRFTLFLRDWAVYLGAVFLFDALRGTIYAGITRFDLPVYMGYAIAAERALLGGRLMPVTLQALWLEPGGPGWLAKLLVIVHASHFVLFLTLGFAIWLLRRPAFAAYCAAMLVLMYAGLLAYAVLPTVPPWMAANTFLVIDPVPQVGLALYNASVPTLVVALATNPVAAMPSLHAAFPALCTLIALEVFGRRQAWMGAYTVLVAVSVMYLGEHYLVDVVAGWLVAVGVFALVYRSGMAAPLQRAFAHPPGRGGAFPRQALTAFAAGAALVLATEGLAWIRTQMQEPWVPTTAFIERELAGRSPVEARYRALRAQKDARRAQPQSRVSSR